jgi:chloramphenicol-sensitive protein RarD
MKRGIILAFTAYLIWGVSPIYWKLIDDVPPLQVVGHRMFWSFFSVLLVILMRKEIPVILELLKNWRSTIAYLASALLLSVNWLVYIWAVNSDFIVDASLGYFINPLLNVLLGVLLLREALRSWQWVSVGMAFLGVSYLTFRLGSIPWIGLILAFTFGIYGLIRKSLTAKSLHGSLLETGYMVLPAFTYLLTLEIRGQGSIVNYPLSHTLLLATTGAFTIFPLVLFGAAVQQVPLSTIGFVQYFAPTLQFLIGVFIYKEAFSQAKLLGFVIIWIALVIFSIEGFLHQRQRSQLAG